MNTVILRKVYALEENTDKFISSGKLLMTDGSGGTQWVNALSTLIITGDPSIGYLPSTLQLLSTVNYANTLAISNLTITVSNVVNVLSNISIGNLTSTVAGLGQIYISSISNIGVSNLTSTVNGLGKIYVSSASNFIATSNLFSTVAGLGSNSRSTVAGLGQIYISSLSNVTFTSNLVSTVNGLGQRYISSLSNVTFTSNLVSTVNGLGQRYISSLSNVIFTSNLTSTVAGLGQRYISTQSLTSSITGITSNLQSNLVSTVNGLGQIYISTSSLTSTVTGVSSNLISSVEGINKGLFVTSNVLENSLTSTINGAGQIYISTSSLVSSVISISDLTKNIRFDNATSVTVMNSAVSFGNSSNINLTSVFFQSNIPYIGMNRVMAATLYGESLNNMQFSTANMVLSPFSNIIFPKTQVSLDIRASLLFSKLGTAASSPVVIPIITMLQYSNIILSNTAVSTFLYAVNTQVPQPRNDGTIIFIDAGNFYNEPIKMILPPNTITSYDQPYTLVHQMPAGLANNAYQNGLHAETIIPYFDRMNSITVTIQNTS